MKRLIDSPQSVRKILLKSILQSIILVAYRCIEDCKLASRWFLVGFVANSIDRILLKRRQSVFHLFVGFVCSVIVVFCCCLFTSSVFSWKRFSFDVLLLALNLKSTFSVLRSSVCKSFPARISSHLLNTLLLSLLLSFFPEILCGDSPTVNIICRWKTALHE